jgi:hypothetical protein
LETILNAGGKLSKGNNAHERKNNGITRKFITNWNPCISSINDAIAVPKAVKSNDIRNMNKNATISIHRFSGMNPTANEIRRTRIHWKIAMLEPPSVLPIMILSLDTGATRISLRNPNCLSRITSIPAKSDVNKMLMQMIPGARNSM